MAETSRNIAACAVILTLTLSVMIAGYGIKEYHAVTQAKALADTADALHRAAGLYITERALGRAMQQQPTPAMFSDVRTFKQTGGKADTAMHTALKHVRTFAPERHRDALKALLKKHRILRDNRRRVLSDISRPLPERSGNTAREWPHVPADIARMLYALSGGEYTAGYAHDMMRVLGDDIAALVAADQPIDARIAERLGRQSGTISNAVRDTVLSSAADNVHFRLAYEGGFRMIYERVIEEGVSGESYITPVTDVRRRTEAAAAAMQPILSKTGLARDAALSARHKNTMLYSVIAVIGMAAGVVLGALLRQSIVRHQVFHYKRHKETDMTAAAIQLEKAAQAMLQKNDTVFSPPYSPDTQSLPTESR